MLTTAETGLNRFLSPYPPKAAQLIVTIYGDIIEPRGGDLWMGDLISLCAGFSVNESLVRTAVSRLVARGQLLGERAGRRSFYGLTETAWSEFRRAADLFFRADDPDCGWILTLCTDPDDQAVLLANGFAPLGGAVYAGADRTGSPRLGTVFEARPLEPGGADLRALAVAAYDLSGLARDYSDFIARFSPMQALADAGPDERGALLARLALLHAYRDIRLRDPRLPAAVLPTGWPGDAARALFASLYLTLSEAADAYIGTRLTARSGFLTANSGGVTRRRTELLDTA